MTYTKRFYLTDDNRWFIDLPEYLEQGGSIEELEMVAGADNLLDTYREHKDSREVTLQFSDDFIEGYLEKLELKEILTEGGALYQSADMYEPAWLCDVVRWMFGDFPHSIYVKVIKNENSKR